MIVISDITYVEYPGEYSVSKGHGFYASSRGRARLCIPKANMCDLAHRTRFSILYKIQLLTNLGQHLLPYQYIIYQYIYNQVLIAHW